MKKIMIGIFLLFLSASAFAMTNVCRIASSPAPTNVKMSTIEFQNYKQKLQNECKLSLRYLKVADQMASRGVSLENINLYQAMRYVRSYDYYRAKMINLPVPLIYQIDDNNKPIDQRNSIVWDNWSKGIAQLGVEQYSILKGMSFLKEDLVRVHIGFYQDSDEVGEYAHDPMKGVFKRAVNNDLSWMILRSADEEVKTAATFAEVNIFYKRIGLINPSYDPAIYDVLRIKPTTDKNGQLVQAVYGGDTRANMEHLRQVLNFMNVMIRQGLAGNHMVYNDYLFTPAEVAFLTQQFYVQVHPFSEGNGRTSRFMQELILTLMGLPHGSSGDLMDIDVYSTFSNYYQVAFDKTSELIGNMEKCSDSYKQNRLKSANKIRRNAKFLDYDCQLIK